MATPTPIQSVTVALRSGVSDATLPNNLKMVAGKNYAISLEDFAKLSRGARESVIDVPTYNTANYKVALNDGSGNILTDLTDSDLNNTAALPTKLANGTVSHKWAVGDVVLGFNDNAFKLVKVDASSTALVAGDVVAWGGLTLTTKAGEAASTVTGDFSDITDQTGETPKFAGSAVGTITAGQYGWIQIAGVATAKVASSVDAGSFLYVYSTDETLGNAENEVQTLTLSSWDDGDTIKLTWDSHESSAVTAPQATAAGFQAAIDEVGALSTTDSTGAGNPNTTGTAYTAGDIVVTRTSATVFVFTFSGASVKHKDVSAITATSGTGSATGAVVETNKGAGGLALGHVVGTAQTAADTGTALVELRSDLAKDVISRRTRLFFDPRT